MGGAVQVYAVARFESQTYVSICMWDRTTAGHISGTLPSAARFLLICRSLRGPVPPPENISCVRYSHRSGRCTGGRRGRRVFLLPSSTGEGCQFLGCSEGPAAPPWHSFLPLPRLPSAPRPTRDRPDVGTGRRPRSPPQPTFPFVRARSGVPELIPWRRGGGECNGCRYDVVGEGS